MHNYLPFIDKIDPSKTLRDLDKLKKVIEDVFVTDEGNQKGVNEYNNAKYSFIHGRLRWHKYVQNQPKKNTIDVNPNAAFWKCVYEDLSQTTSQQSVCTEERQKTDLNIIEDIKSSLTSVSES